MSDLGFLRLSNKNEAMTEDSGMGRPTKYSKDMNEIVYRLCLLGLKDKEIAAVLDVSESTLNNWKGVYPDFLESMQEGKLIADGNIVKGLYKRGEGVTVEETKVEYKIVDGKEIPVSKTVIKKELPPDVTACKVWLGNRQRSKWNNVKEEDSRAANIDPQERQEALKAAIEKVKQNLKNND